MEVLTTERVPIKLWPPSGEIDWTDDVLQQFRNLANHPLAFKHVCGMPDYHLGYGMPLSAGCWPPREEWCRTPWAWTSAVA